MNSDHSILTVGTVVDTNDPQQNGRLRVNCPKWGDTDETLVVDIPWANYVSPFAGILTRGGRGPENAATGGPVAYGMWAIPKVGATVVCMLLDGDPNHRVWVGCIHAEHMTHTLPMGRYLDNGNTGPVSSTEQPIEPIASNMTEAFGPTGNNPERLTRGAENQSSSIKNTIIDKVVSSRADYRNGIYDRTGYQQSRVAPEFGFEETEGGSFDPQTYSITTPGLHSFIMDDSLKNGKIRIRSTSGNQIILDDTNERIYISSAEGKNWIEMDQAGNVDVYSDRRVSMHALKGFNFTTEGEFRVSAKSFHVRTTEDIRMHANANVGVRADVSMFLQANTGNLEIEIGNDWTSSVANDIVIKASNNIEMLSVADMHVYSGATLNLTSVGQFNINVGSNLEIESSAKVEVLASDNINLDGNQIHLNDGLASGADQADQASPPTAIIMNGNVFAYTTSRVPIHEPWGRISNDEVQTDQDATENVVTLVLGMQKNSSILELSYNDPAANKIDLGDELGRNGNWRR